MFRLNCYGLLAQLCHSLTRAVAHHGIGDDYLTRFQRFLDKTFNVSDFNDFMYVCGHYILLYTYAFVFLHS